MKRLLASIPVIVLLFAPSGAANAQEDPVDWEEKGINLIAEYARLLESTPSEAARVVSMYSSYLQTVPYDGKWDYAIASVHARRAEAYVVNFAFDSAEEDYRKANGMWPGIARESLLRPPPERIVKKSIEEEEEPGGGSSSSSSSSWSDYYDLGDFAFTPVFRGGAMFFTGFQVQKKGSFNVGAKIKPVDDLGFEPIMPHAGAFLTLSIGDNVDFNLVLDMRYGEGVKDTTKTLEYHGVNLNPSGGTVSLRSRIRVADMEFYMSTPIDDDSEGYSDFMMGFNFMYFETRIASSGTAETAFGIERMVLPWLGFRLGAELTDDTLFFSFTLRAMYFWWPLSNYVLTEIYLLGRLEFNWRPASFMILTVAAWGQQYSWDEQKNRHNRDVFVLMQGFGGELGLELRF